MWILSSCYSINKILKFVIVLENEERDMYINCHTHFNDISADISILNNDPQKETLIASSNALLSFGVHPWVIHKMDISQLLKKTYRYSQEGKIVAIGECGLDSTIYDLELQKHIFLQQVLISEEFNKPVIIHSVRQSHEILHLRKETKSKQPWIIHGFRGKIEAYNQFIKQNIFVSLGPGFFRNIENAKAFFKLADLNFILLETDDTNGRIKDIYKFIETNIDLRNNDLKVLIEQNFKKIFSLSWNG